VAIDSTIRPLDKYQEHFLISVKSRRVGDEELYIIKRRRQ
jgi:hypothetical protein